MTLARTIFAAALGLAVAAPTFAVPAFAQDVRIVRTDRDGMGMHRRVIERRTGFAGCRTTVIRRETPRGTVVRRIKRCG